MCSYQVAKYDITNSDILAGTQVAAVSVNRAYGKGDYVEIAIPLRVAIREMRAYYAILGVGSIGFSSLQAIATFSMLNQC